MGLLDLGWRLGTGQLRINPIGLEPCGALALVGQGVAKEDDIRGCVRFLSEFTMDYFAREVLNIEDQIVELIVPLHYFWADVNVASQL